MFTEHVQYMLLLLVLVVNLTGTKFYGVTRSYSSCPFLCALVLVITANSEPFWCCLSPVLWCDTPLCIQWRKKDCSNFGEEWALLYWDIWVWVYIVLQATPIAERGRVWSGFSPEFIGQRASQDHTPHLEYSNIVSSYLTLVACVPLSTKFRVLDSFISSSSSSC